MVVIGKNVDSGDSVKIDLPTLVRTRLLVQANSGGGKSYLLRKILEETEDKIQRIVLDIEGEFVTLREKCDFVVCGKEGDVPVNIRAAEMLAKMLLELKASAIIDLYELKQHERVLFVKRFLEAMINAPKELWHPVLVVVDEAHIFAPQGGKCESAGAVIDLATRGRKRGFTALLATQRISKLDKDVCAEMNNKLIGRTGLDVDMKRAAEELGFTSKEDMRSLRELEAGEFFGFGAAISKSVIKLKVGKVKTTHPEIGSGIASPVAPAKGKVLEALKKLKELPIEVEKELNTKTQLEAEIRSLRGQLAATKRPEVKIDEKAIERVRVEAQNSAKKVFQKNVDVLIASNKKLRSLLNDISQVTGNLPPEPKLEEFLTTQKSNFQGVVKREPIAVSVDTETFANNFIGGGAVRMLKALALFYPEPLNKTQIAVLSQISINGGSFSTYLSALKSNGLVSVRGENVEITQEGLDKAGDVGELPKSVDELVRLWENKFSGGAKRMLRIAVEKYPDSISKDELSETANVRGGSFGTYLSALRSSGLIEVNGIEIKASEWLFKLAK